MAGFLSLGDATGVWIQGTSPPPPATPGGLFTFYCLNVFDRFSVF